MRQAAIRVRIKFAVHPLAGSGIGLRAVSTPRQLAGNHFGSCSGGPGLGLRHAVEQSVVGCSWVVVVT